MDKLYGLAGKNIGYSHSPALFKEFFKRAGMHAEYRLFDIPEPDALKDLFAIPDLKGFNVTIPYKQAIIPLLDQLSAGAGKTGVVNTVKYENGKWKGYNTDIDGFRQALDLFISPTVDRALVLGNGATARTVRYVLREKQIPFHTISRTKQKNVISYDELTPELVRKHPLIINTTPLGNKNYPGQKPPLPYHALSPFHYLMDLNYNPPYTPFLAEGLQRGAQVKNGLGMLMFQAIKSFEIWTGQTLPEP